MTMDERLKAAEEWKRVSTGRHVHHILSSYYALYIPYIPYLFHSFLTILFFYHWMVAIVWFFLLCAEVLTGDSKI